ncbi:hypothetical protein [Paraburkholderia caribensis]|uniref:hypothetical protein n=1 Tax=Paraburkholderia caribensis TaxID=75105 RepID=UPI000AC3E46F|nr:hypothetical protein [Paraburkholderia caribensis]
MEDREAVSGALDERAIGVKGWYERLKIEAPQWSKTLPQLPRLIHHALAQRHDAQQRGINDENHPPDSAGAETHEPAAAKAC